jgi:Tfp pilus assembly protein PilN
MIRINLAPEGKRRRGFAIGLPSIGFPSLTLPSLNLGTLFAVVYVLLIVGIAAYWWALGSQQARLTAEIAAGQVELNELRVTIAKVNAVKAQATELRRRLLVLEELMKGQRRPIALVDNFVNVIPKDLWITNLEAREDLRLKVVGAAFSTTAVSDFMQNLRSSGKFRDVDIVVSRRDLSKPAGLVTFEVTCRFDA